MFIDLALKEVERLTMRRGKAQAAAGEGGGMGEEEKQEELQEQWEEFDEANIQSERIKERQEDINEIESLMTEIHTMTNDMAVEVAKADTKLDQIMENARVTKEETAAANENINKGAEYQTSSMKCT